MSNPHLPVGWDQPEITPAHWHEWVEGSGVDPEIVRLNVISLVGDEVLEALLGDRLERAGGHAQQYVTGEIRKLIHSREQLAIGGWWCEGLCTLNGCRTIANWGVFKPDHPRVDPNGRIRKYEHPLGVPERIVALRMPDRDYWARIKADPTIPIVLDESGGKKCGAWLTAGIPALGLPGLFAGTPPANPADPEPYIGNGYGKRRDNSSPRRSQPPKQRKLHPDLAGFAPGRRFVVSFDYEPTAEGQRRRDAATRHLVEQLYAAGASSVAIAHRQGPEKGADDLLIAHGPAELHALIAQAENVDRGTITPTYAPQPSTALTGDRHAADLLADHIASRIYSARQYAAENDCAVEPVLEHLTNTPGTGKSHLVPQVAPRLLEIPGIDRVIYVSSTYRSPSIGELNRWAYPPSRHNGLVVENIDGHQRLRRRKKSDPAAAVVEQPNCEYSGNLQRLRDQGGSTEAITHFCSKLCPVRMGCRYRQDQHEFILGIKSGEHRLIRCSTESLPALQHWLGKKDWPNTYLIFDEAPQLESAAIRTRQIHLEQFPAWGTYLRTVDPDVMASTAGQQLTALLDALATLPDRISDPQQRKYGLIPQQLIKALPPVPDPADLNLAPLDAGLTGITADNDQQHQTDSPLLLGQLLTALRPPQPDRPISRAFYAPQDKGTITVLSATTFPAVALAAAGSLVLDGTAATDDINRALHAGIRWKADSDKAHLNPLAINTPSNLGLATLEIIQIPDLGPMGASRGADKQRRLETLLPAIQQWIINRFDPTAHLGVLEKSHFRSREAGHGVWFVDNQGSNAYQHDRALAMVGCPAPNLTASLAQFQVTHNDPHASLQSTPFRNWYGRRMGEQLIQGIHRLRPVRRHGETLLLFLITSIDLKGIGITGAAFKQLPASHFSKAAAPKADRTRERVIAAIEQLHALGLNPSQRAVAERAGISKTQTLRQAGGQDWAAFVEGVIYPF